MPTLIRFAAVGAALLAMTTPALAQTRDPLAAWTRPVVTQIEFTISRSGERNQTLDVGRPIRMAAGERVTIGATAFDQNGRRFPRDRFRLDADPDIDCDDRVDISDWSSSGEWRVSARNSRGPCTVVVWVPGNLNLEYELTFEVSGLGTTNYTREQADEIVARLYRAILQRDVDEPSRRSAVAEIQRGRIENQVRSMIGSGEFQQIRQQQDPAAIITAFYQGLLDREPDSRGLRQYLDELGRGRHAQAVMNLIQSEEFEETLLGR